MADFVGGLTALVEAMDTTGELNSARLGLAIGAPPPQAELDLVSGIVDADEDTTNEVLSELQDGPASAVLNVEQLTCSMDLPDNLTAI